MFFNTDENLFPAKEALLRLYILSEAFRSPYIALLLVPFPRYIPFISILIYLPYLCFSYSCLPPLRLSLLLFLALSPYICLSALPLDP